MFEKLQSKWKVSAGRLLLILITFAVGGSLCGIAGRNIMGLTKIEKGVLWFVVYVMVVTVIWPLCVITVSIPLGQFVFFRNYIRKLFGRMGGRRKLTEGGKYIKGEKHMEDERRGLNIAIFASGAGTNAEKIIQDLPELMQTGIIANICGATVGLIITNNPDAGVLNIASLNSVPSEILDLKSQSADQQAEAYLSVLHKYKIDFIVLAGYLKKIPAGVINAYPQKIVNIHPALLPAYGGAGMYGKRVHEAVIRAGGKESGISIHYVDEIYDNGEIIFQAKCKIDENETPETLAEKIHVLEHRHYTEVIADILQSQNPR